MNHQFVHYDGRRVAKESFRAFVYGKNGAKKLARNWAEHKALLKTGEWFSSEEEVLNNEQSLQKEAEIEPKESKSKEKVAKEASKDAKSALVSIDNETLTEEKADVNRT